MKMKLNLFAGSYTVTVYKDAHMTTASASPSSSLAKDDTVALTLTPASGYEVANVEVVSGGDITIYEGESITFSMPNSSVVLYVTSKANNAYRVVEPCFCCVNQTVTKLNRNMKLVFGKNGAIIGVEGEDTTITLNADMVANLLASGVIVKEPAWEGEEEPDDT